MIRMPSPFLFAPAFGEAKVPQTVESSSALARADEFTQARRPNQSFIAESYEPPQMPLREGGGTALLG